MKIRTKKVITLLILIVGIIFVVIGLFLNVKSTNEKQELSLEKEIKISSESFKFLPSTIELKNNTNYMNIKMQNITEKAITISKIIIDIDDENKKKISQKVHNTKKEIAAGEIYEFSISFPATSSNTITTEYTIYKVETN